LQSLKTISCKAVINNHLRTAASGLHPHDIALDRLGRLSATDRQTHSSATRSLVIPRAISTRLTLHCRRYCAVQCVCVCGAVYRSLIERRRFRQSACNRYHVTTQHRYSGVQEVHTALARRRDSNLLHHRRSRRFTSVPVIPPLTGSFTPSHLPRLTILKS